MNLLGVQSQVVTDQYRTMVRATWPTAMKVIVPGGLDAGLLAEWRARRPDGILVVRPYFPDEALAPSKITEAVRIGLSLKHLAPVIECPINEAHQTDPADIAALSAYSVVFVDACRDAGLVPAVGVFSEGNPNTFAWWQQFYPALRAARAAKGYLALHEYGVPSLGFEDWHLLRHRRVWPILPDDCKLPILITECGIDGGIEGRREQGWRAYMDAPGYRNWLRTYHAELGRDPYVHGATVFLCGGNDQWRSFDVTDEVDLRGVFTESLTAALPRWFPTAPVPNPTPEPTMPDWYPAATQRPISVNYTTGRHGQTVKLIVHHIADGLGDPFTWFNTDRGEFGSSAHFWISKLGKVVQYRPLGDTCWANGPVCQPDTTNPVITMVTAAGQVNAQSVAVEHEGRPGDPMPYEQWNASRTLTRWLASVYKLPVDRVRVVGHYQIDRCTRANCPGPTHPWAAILQGVTPPVFNIDQVRSQLWTIADTLAANGYPWFSQGIKALVTLSKGER